MKKIFYWAITMLCACSTTHKTVNIPKKQPMVYTGIYPRADWASSANVYEVNVRQYTPEGTFNAFSAHLQRLKNMGVNTLWFMPVTPIAQKSKKGSLGSPYACSDYTSINPELGTLQDFKDLVNKAHDMGFKVMIDWVANHTGWDHRWTTEHPDYYKRDPNTQDFKVASGMDDIIELDYDNPNMRMAMIAAMKYWIDQAGVDGFRCDLASWVRADFWTQARTELEKTKNLFWLGEFDPNDHPDYMQVFDCAYTWNWMHKSEDYAKGKTSFDDLMQTLHGYDNAGGPNALKLWFTANHDENSWNGTEYEKYGNLAKALAVFCYTWPGVPLTYSGQELPNGKRLKFFDRDPIEWGSAPPALEGFYAILNSLKARHKALLSGNANGQTVQLPLTNGNHRVLAFTRQNLNDRVTVFLNLGQAPVSFRTMDGFADGAYTNVFTGADVMFDHNKEISMGGGEFLVLATK